MTKYREDIRNMLLEGKSYREIRASLGCSNSTVSFHATKIREENPGFIGVYQSLISRDWKAVQQYYDQGFSRNKTMQFFGISNSAWRNAIERGEVIPREKSFLPPEEHKYRSSAKSRLIRDGVLKEECSQCGILWWQGIKLSLHLHHKNGQSGDHRPENVCLLCPNCHSITDNYAGKNKGIANVPNVKVRLDRK